MKVIMVEKNSLSRYSSCLGLPCKIDFLIMN